MTTLQQDHEYNHDQIDQVWDRAHQLLSWYQIEAALIYVKTGLALTPNHQRFLMDHYLTPEAVATREQRVGHEVGAFLAQFELGIAELVYAPIPGITPPDLSLTPDQAHQVLQYLHFGLTSSDLVESSKQIALWRTSDILRDLANHLLNVVDHLPSFPVPGRTHGQIASPTSARHRFQAALPPMYPWHSLASSATIKLSGAVGRSRVLPTRDQVRVAGALSSAYQIRATLAKHATQVPPAWLVTQHLALWADWVTACEQIALDYRLMATLGGVNPRRVEVGSSAMPGKVNPYLAERIGGLASMWRGMYSSILNSRALWLDRDLTHSSVDREFLPRMASLLGYMLKLTTRILQEADYPAADMSRFEPAIDADALMAYAIEEYKLTRADAYREVAELIPQSTTTAGVVVRLADAHGPFGWDKSAVVADFYDQYPEM